MLWHLMSPFKWTLCSWESSEHLCFLCCHWYRFCCFFNNAIWPLWSFARTFWRHCTGTRSHLDFVVRAFLLYWRVALLILHNLGSSLIHQSMSLVMTLLQGCILAFYKAVALAPSLSAISRDIISRYSLKIPFSKFRYDVSVYLHLWYWLSFPLVTITTFLVDINCVTPFDESVTLSGGRNSEALLK